MKKLKKARNGGQRATRTQKSKSGARRRRGGTGKRQKLESIRINEVEAAIEEVAKEVAEAASLDNDELANINVEEAIDEVSDWSEGNLNELFENLSEEEAAQRAQALPKQEEDDDDDSHNLVIDEQAASEQSSTSTSRQHSAEMAIVKALAEEINLELNLGGCRALECQTERVPSRPSRLDLPSRSFIPQQQLHCFPAVNLYESTHLMTSKRTGKRRKKNAHYEIAEDADKTEAPKYRTITLGDETAHIEAFTDPIFLRQQRARILRKIPRHYCSPVCIDEQARERLKSFKGNLFMRPILLGFSRIAVKQPPSPVESPTSEADSAETEEDEPTLLGDMVIRYVTPCGKVLWMMEHIEQYLTKVALLDLLQVDCFTFSVRFTLQQCTVQAREYIGDISHGEEIVPVSMINETKQLYWSIGGAFHYTARRFFDSRLRGLEESMKQFVSCCGCEDDCASESCSCKRLTAEMNCGKGHGYTHRRLFKHYNFGIYECNHLCSCSTIKCPNRLVQLGLRNHIQIFRSASTKGWGLRALHFIPRGQFICTYNGMILQVLSSEGTHRSDYLADLDYIETCCHQSEESNQNREQLFAEISQKKFSIDGTVAANLGRCVNHSCQANLFVQNVFIETHDIRLPHLAMFARRDIYPFEEICWNYNYRKAIDKKTVIYCRCSALNCHLRLI